jgi:hypothetical protein
VKGRHGEGAQRDSPQAGQGGGAACTAISEPQASQRSAPLGIATEPDLRSGVTGTCAPFCISRFRVPRPVAGRHGVFTPSGRA